MLGEGVKNIMKSLLLSIKPKWVAKILNGEKTIEIRKKFPKDYVGWVYIYNTKKTKDGVLKLAYIGNKLEFVLSYDKTSKYQGKVVARFWCDKVEHIEYETCSRDISGWWKDDGKMFNHKDACLTYEEMFDYIGSGEGYAIHITKLEIFDKPKDISEFKSKLHIKGGCKNCPQYTGFSMPYCATCDFLLPLNRAPQSWCYVEE